MRVRLCRPSAFLVAQLCEQADQEDQEPTTQSAEQATSQANSAGGGSPSQWAAGTSSPEEDKFEREMSAFRMLAITPRCILT